ncbi:MAG: NUDIX hydrolase [Gammaproteobacteria bacterium]|nr:NUDIX hydrolase [Gammaproteobacteria bacterium]
MAGSVPAVSAAIILVRDSSAGPQILLLRRHAGSGFMPDHFVFPGGMVDAAESDPRLAAIRELFEEAGVLLVTGTLPRRHARWRARLNAGEVTFTALLRAHGLVPDAGALRLWGRWITPSLRAQRFDARFYVARLPAGQCPSFDARETVEDLWLTPAEALQRQASGDLPLPPPQLHTLSRLAHARHPDVAALLDSLGPADEREAPILPRVAAGVAPRTLLLPWDRGYERDGSGDTLALPAGHALAAGPSRVVLDGDRWRLVDP